jgi:4-amino-4-deoxy-L-arabinose transferase-like glycosyltransferase
MRPPGWIAAVAVAATLGVALGMIAAPWWGHVDDTDAHLYRVVARHMVEDGTWLDLRYLPGAHAAFREHLPFGIWPYAAAIHVAGEEALPGVGAMFTLATIALVLWMGWRLAGAAAGIVAALTLAATESFTVYGGRERLDPVLVLFTTAAMAPLLVGSLRRGGLAMSALFGSLATLVKGPFGLLPVCAGAAARALEERSLRGSVRLAAVVAVSALPFLAFLAWSRTAADRSWWDGYAVAQLWASAAGVRTDGQLAPWFPLATIASRFWPGLPFVAVGAWLAARGTSEHARELRRLAIASTFVVAGLCLPARKVWNHALVAYPLLALLGAVAVGPWLERRLASPSRVRSAVGALCALAAAVWLAAGMGAGKAWLRRPCIAPGPVDDVLRTLEPGADVLVISTPVDWRLVGALASERRLVPWPMERAEQGIPPLARPALALVREPHLGARLAAWREVARGDGWIALAPETSTDPTDSARANDHSLR